MKLITKAEAKKQGLRTYYSGKLCSKGHDAERYTNSDKCLECHKQRNASRDRSKSGKSGKVLTVNTLTIKKPPTKDWRYYSAQIAAAWQKATESILKTGELLIEAKLDLQHGEFEKLVEAELPFGPRTARMLMVIAANPVLSNRNHGSVLPPSWRTLYELCKLDERTLLAKIEDHTINPSMERKEVALLLGPERQTKRSSKPSTGDTFAAMAQEIEDHKAHIADLEAAREVHGVVIDTDDDEAAVAAKVLSVIGNGRVALLIAELQKLLASADDTPSSS